MSDRPSTWSKLRSWRHRGEKGKAKAKRTEDSIAIHGSRAGRPSVPNQVSTAPTRNTSTASPSPTQQAPEPSSSQAHGQSNQPKPYADNYDLWDEALDSLEEDDRSAVKMMLKDWDQGSPKRKDLVAEIQATMDGALKSKHHDRTTSIGKLLSVLNKFLSAGDVAVSFDPTHAALPWAAVRCVIVIFTAHNELKGVILTGMAEVTSLLVRCDMYQLLYMAPDPALRPPDDVLAKLRTCIVQTYAGLQSFFAFVERQQTNFKIDSVFKLEDARAHIDKLSGSQKQLLQVADDCEKSCDLSSRSDLKELLGLSSEIPIIRQQVDMVLERIDARDEREILEWISPIPYGEHHRVRVESRTPDTCEWLIQTKEFCEWMDYGSSAILRLQGSMGAGKTYITSKVIDHVRGLLESSSDHAGFAFFYCNRNEENRREPLCILQSYVRQLSTPVGSTERIRKSLKIVSNQTRRQASHLGLEACKTQLMESVNEYSQTVIILDALDECDDYSRWQLTDVIKGLVSESKRSVKVFISSRPENDINTQYSGKNITIQAINNQGDIEKFVNAEIDRPRKWGPISTDLRKLIVQVLCRNSQGMFQWAYLQIKQVLGLSTTADIKIRLGKLPKDLEAAYEEIYSEIANEPRRKALVDRACMWVMSACTPLSSDKLLSAVHIDADGSSINSQDQFNESELLDRCSNLLVIDPQTNFWRLSHLSVREYFERNHWGLQELHLHAAKVCLKLLIEIYKSPTHESGMGISDHMHNTQSPNELSLVHPMKEYVQHHWVIHVRYYDYYTTKEGQKADSWLANLLKRFLGSPSKSSSQYRAWYRSVLPPVRRGTPRSSFLHWASMIEISPDDVTICAMCRFSFYAVLEDWWNSAEDTFSQINSRGTTTLELAAKGGSNHICEILIKQAKAIHPILSDDLYRKALLAAISQGNVNIVMALIDHGADMNDTLRGLAHTIALAAAAFKGGKTDIVKILLKKGADVNRWLPDQDWSALGAAAWGENGADVNLPLAAGHYGSALAAATAAAANWPGRAETIKVLIENGADVNLLLSCGKYGSALAAAAACSGRAETIKFLIENGADVNLLLSVGEYGSALAGAANGERFEIVKILIENGADVNLLLSGGRYGSALAAAAASFTGGAKTVNVLIENGADVNLPLVTGKYGSALAAAACSGYTEIVRVLLENGADVNQLLPCGRYGSALVAAIGGDSAEIIRVFKDSGEVVRILIENGADVNLPLLVGQYGSALAAAAYRGQVETVKSLIGHGADVNLLLPGGRYGSALAAAAAAISEREIETDESLSESDADMNSLFADSFTSIDAATAGLREVEIIQILIDNGADVNLPLLSGRYGSALAAAAGHKDVVKILLDNGAIPDLVSSI
ncbi:hypothetical protein N7541_010579 [Penicillium brevicompactum]|uniref:Nephrocystin 3-like N-terminal domain-containing protein n=1 Tax=Penicillium brevicompactum TaxID=5074 RepID=A0A9W9QQ76_PENBR|nr:hypothetical protein N7541_010579 [Penicillium brevicompactum]